MGTLASPLNTVSAQEEFCICWWDVIIIITNKAIMSVFIFKFLFHNQDSAGKNQCSRRRAVSDCA